MTLENTIRAMDKKTARVFRKIKGVRGLSLEEKCLYARTLAATPDERWAMNQKFLQSLGLQKRSARQKRGLSS
jgi:hypothetical protein